ncbi:MAG: carbohydrate kinase family protein [Candidatus Anstonellales archaeon]
MPEQKIAVVGNINRDIIAKAGAYIGKRARAEYFEEKIGGSATNYARALAKLGSRTWLFANAGRDLSQVIFSDLRSYSVNVEYIRTVNEKNGTVIVITEGKQKRMIFWRGANDTLRNRNFSALEHFDIVHISDVEKEIAEKIIEKKKKGTKLFIDPGYSLSLPASRIKKILSSTHTIFIEGKEAEIITGKKSSEKAIKALHGHGVKNVLFKAENGLIFSDGKKMHFQPIAPVKTTDTTAVGDVVGAAFIHFVHTKKYNIKKALIYAELAAAVKVMHYGFYAPSFLEIQEMERKLKWKV